MRKDFENIQLYFFLRMVLYLFTFKEYNCFTTLCYFLLYNTVDQLYVYIHSLPPGLPLHPPSHSSIPPQSTELSSCAIQQLPISCLFHTWQRIYLNSTICPITVILDCSVNVNKQVFLNFLINKFKLNYWETKQMDLWTKKKIILIYWKKNHKVWVIIKNINF